MSCLTRSFKLLLFLIVVGAIAAGWLYRDRLLAEARDLIGAGSEPAVGRPDRAALETARGKIASLDQPWVDSVVLTAPEMASLIQRGLDPVVREQLDSIEVRLHDGVIEIAALLSTERLPREVVGPFAIGLRPEERIVAAGPIRVPEPGRAEWVVRQIQIGDFPLPRDAVPKLVEKALANSNREALSLRLPPGVRGVQVEPEGVILFGGMDR